jgi:hypothetical protein
MGNGKVLVTGGNNNAGVTHKTAEVYDASLPVGTKWQYVADMHVARLVHTATLLSDGKKVLVAGGKDGGNISLDNAEIYDSDTTSWTSVASMNKRRSAHRAVLLSSGHVLVSGGESDTGKEATAEMYDPESNTWTLLPAFLNAARSGHGMVVLDTGAVLVLGGSGTSATLDSAEVYIQTP